MTAAVIWPAQGQRWASLSRRRRAGGPGQGEHLGPGQELAGQDDDLAPQLVLGEALQGQVAPAGVLGATDPVLTAIAVARWRIEEDHQLSKQAAGLDAGQVIRWKSWHRWTAISLLAYIYLAVAVAVQRQHEADSNLDAGADPDHRQGLLQLLRDTVIPPPRRDRPHRLALVGRAPPPPAPRQPSPPALERLSRDNIMITTNLCSGVGLMFSSIQAMNMVGLFHSGVR